VLPSKLILLELTFSLVPGLSHENSIPLFIDWFSNVCRAHFLANETCLSRHNSLKKKKILFALDCYG
jgi:hypothetical protein